MKKLLSSFLLCICIFAGKAQNLKQTSVDISKDRPYFSLTTGKSFDKKGASSADLLYDENVIGKDTEKSFYNLSEKSGKSPDMISDKPVVIAGLSWDRDTWNRCKTVADLKRMTTNITNNSFSFFASIANNSTGDITYPCFIVQQHNGKRGIMFLSKKNNTDIHVEIKMEP
jgi:hypothetical protein